MVTSAMTRNLKRSLTIQGHSTSLSLEAEFWAELQLVAQQEKLSIAALVQKIDGERQNPNLSSAVRIYLLQRLQSLRQL
jgi:predicted DNA-binding ribbon-helix-helix protein